MLFLEFFTWWYSAGYMQLIDKIRSQLRIIWNVFSIPILLRTLFAPWKRIQSDAGKSLQSHFQAVIDNLISRCIGFVIRLLTIITAIVCLIVIICFGVILVIFWPLMPPAVPVLIVWGLL